ncbi:carbohydrate kinase family protein [Rhizobium wuzhouense]|uniref:Carbohydrate kinase n=1 Tax=Rhizobium wuzhouense TaxID=1986026 RepID=A0ABX5NKI8_9HYPH|nr:PfkB family carbohydrate kinase [Rhizobium wuzhouense]PYB69884.1 carbohydrate kinase [Rhizobium wuzhouense]
MQTPPPKPLVVIGNLNIDIIIGPATWPEVGTEVFVDQDEVRVGGSAGNTALALQTLGHPHTFIGSVGSDTFGTILEQAFAPETCRLIKCPARTTLTVGITHPDSERTFFTTRGHLPHLSADDVIGQLDTVDIDGGTVLLSGAFQTERLMADYDLLIRAANARGATIAVDPGWPTGGFSAQTRSFLQNLASKSRCVLLNETEAMHLSGADTPEAAARAIHALQPPDAETVVKCGSRGALVLDVGGGLRWVNAPKVDVIDTIGAGDVFNAGYLSGRSLGHSPAVSLGRAVALASRAISTQPRRYELNENQQEPQPGQG